MADCGSLESLMTSLTNEVAALKTKVANLESKQSQYATKQELSAVESSLTALIDSVKRALDGYIAQILRTIEELRQLVLDLLRKLLGLDNGGLEQRVKNLEIRVTGLESVTNFIRRAVEALQSRVGRLESRVASLESVIAEFLRRISALENTVGQILQDIKNIYNTLTGHGKRISALENTVGQILQDIKNIYNTLTGHGKRISALENTVERILQDIRNIYNTLTGHGKRISALENTVGQILQDIRNLIAEFTAFKIVVAALKALRNGRDGKDGKDAKVEYETVNVPLVLESPPDVVGKVVIQEANADIQVIKGTGGAAVLLHQSIARITRYIFHTEEAQIRVVGCDSKTGLPSEYETRMYTKGTKNELIQLHGELAEIHSSLCLIKNSLGKPQIETEIVGDVSIADNWTISSGFTLSNPDNDPRIQAATIEVNNLLSAAVTLGKNYAGENTSDDGSIVQAAAGGALVPVGKSLIALIPVIVSLFKGFKLPTAILLDTIGQIIREILLEQIKSRLPSNQGEAIAAVPEWWQVRPGGDRPQLVVLYGEALPDNRTGRSRYALTIPYYKFTGQGKPVFPTYQKGSWEGILTLKDNSKVNVNAISYAEASRVLDAIKAFIDPAMLTNSSQKIGERKGLALKTINVKPCTAKYFATGQQNTNPTYTLNLQ